MKLTIVTKGPDFKYRKVLSWSSTTDNEGTVTFVINTKRGTKRLIFHTDNLVFVRED